MGDGVVSILKDLTLAESKRRCREAELDPLQRLLMEVLHEAGDDGIYEDGMWELVAEKIASLPVDEQEWFIALPVDEQHRLGEDD